MNGEAGDARGKPRRYAATRYAGHCEPAMFLGYNTNGLAHHELLDAVRLLADVGYGGVAITIDHGLLSPRDAAWREQLVPLRRLLRQLNMRSVIETAPDSCSTRGKTRTDAAVADPASHATTGVRLCDPLRARLETTAYRSGRVLREEIPYERALVRWWTGLGDVLDDAAKHGVTIGFEPEPRNVDRLDGPVWRVAPPRRRSCADARHRPLACQARRPSPT